MRSHSQWALRCLQRDSDVAACLLDPSTPAHGTRSDNNSRHLFAASCCASKAVSSVIGSKPPYQQAQNCKLLELPTLNTKTSSNIFTVTDLVECDRLINLRLFSCCSASSLLRYGRESFSFTSHLAWLETLASNLPSNTLSTDNNNKPLASSL